MFSVLIPFAFCFYLQRGQVTLPPGKISKRKRCLFHFFTWKISDAFATLTPFLIQYIGQVIFFKAKWTLLVLPNPLQCENCKSSPSSQIPPSDSPVICHMAYSSYCSTSYCIPLAHLLFLSILASAKPSSLAKCLSPCCPHLSFPMPCISQMFGAYSCLVQHIIFWGHVAWVLV